MKPKYLYFIPAIWFTVGILYARSIPKNGFAGVAEVFWVLLITIILILGIITYQILHHKKVNKK